jgi:hypothetical protein
MPNPSRILAQVNVNNPKEENGAVGCRHSQCGVCKLKIIITCRHFSATVLATCQCSILDIDVLNNVYMHLKRHLCGY